MDGARSAERRRRDRHVEDIDSTPERGTEERPFVFHGNLLIMYRIAIFTTLTDNRSPCDTMTAIVTVNKRQTTRAAR